MKTISLDEKAYQRLKEWKQDGNDSFSKVVLRMVPERGTVGAVAEFAETYRTDALPNQEILERTVEEQSFEKEDPWN